MLMALCLTAADRWANCRSARAPHACLFRETALPILVVMAAFALYERRYCRGAGWRRRRLCSAACSPFHLLLAAPPSTAGRCRQPGWLDASGLPFIIATARANALLVRGCRRDRR